MTNQEILDAAMRQSAIDLHCKAEDFVKAENVIVNSSKDEKARRYLKLPFVCNMVTYGSNIVASIQPEYYDIVHSYLSNYDVGHCFETPNMHVLNDAFLQMGFKVCFMAEYFLPDVNALKITDCPYETKILEQSDFQDLYTGQWSNALCSDSSLTGRLAAEIIKRDKVPFYCCAWCNLKSARNAVKSGFRPAWAEMTVKSVEEVDEMNNAKFESELQIYLECSKQL